jgi:hypothetical protein
MGKTMVAILSAPMLLAALPVTAQAATLVRTGNDTQSNNQQAFAGSILANDLINAGSKSLLSVTQTGYTAFGNSSQASTVLNDGMNGANTNGFDSSGGAFDSDGTFSLVYKFDLSTARNGYDLTRISSFAAHEDNRTGQNYTVFVSYVTTGVDNFVNLGSFIGSNAGGLNQASRLTLENDVNSGVDAFASGVAAIRFDIAPADPAATIYREFDVVGTAAAVPEPATWAMMLLGFGMIGATARFRRRSIKVSLV